MSYPHQFGYSYSNTASSLGSPQLLVSGSPTQTSITTSCCENGRPIMTDPHTCQTVCSCQYNSPLLSGYTRMTGLPDYSSAAYVAQGYVPFGADPTAFTSVNYSSLNASYDLKDTTDSAWRSLTSQTACYPYDPTMVYPYGPGGYNMEINGGIRRKNATRETTSTLKAWLYEHRKNPYPTKGEKIMLAIITKMTLTQVSTWFANARRRLKKENKMTWSPRNRCGEDGEKGDSDIEVDEKDDDDDRHDDKSHSGDDKKDDDDLDDLVKAVSAAESNSGEDGPSRIEAKLDNGIGSLTHSRSPTSCASPPRSPSPISEPPTLAPHAGSPAPEPPILRAPHSPSPKLLLPTATVTSSVTSHTASVPHNGTSTYSSRPNHTAPSEGHVTPQKPRIWSLADTATSSSPPSIRRSPPHSLQSGPTIGQSIGPPPPTAPQNSFSSPLNSIRQWMEGSYPVSVSHGVGLSHAYAMAARSMSAAGVTSTMTTPNAHMSDRGALVGSRFAGSTLSSHPLLFPHPDLSRLTNGLVDRHLGQKGDGVNLSSSLGGTDGDDLTKTAFKPVLKSMH